MSEAPPIRSAFGQAFARLSQSSAKVVDTAGSCGHPFPAAGCLSHDRRICRDLTPSPYSRSVPRVERPGFSPRSGGAGRTDGRGFADAVIGPVSACGFCFIDASAAVSSRAITTQRGNEPCGNTLSFLHLRPRRLRAACRPRPSAGWPAPLPGRPLPMRRTRTWLQAPHWARWPGLRPAVCRGCRPAVATDLIACPLGRADRIARPSGHAAPVAFVISAPRPGRGGRGERCSRRS